MYLDVPFVMSGVLATEHSFALVDGPDAETMRLLVASKDDWDWFEQPLEFRTPGYVWPIAEVFGIMEHPWLPDAWWISAVTPYYADPGGMEIYLLWSPNNSLHGYLARHVDLIDSEDW
jgi:hypothetical protein